MLPIKCIQLLVAYGLALNISVQVSGVSATLVARKHKIGVELAFPLLL
jgi:hypothetical protein